MSQSEKAAKSILVMIIFGTGSKLLGFIREMLIAKEFGSGIETDTFFIALAAVTLFSTLITQALSTTMIPIMSEVEEKEGRAGKLNHTNNLFNIVILFSLGLVMLGWLLAPVIIRGLAYGFEGEQFNLAVLLVRLGMPAVLFAGIVGTFRGYLQSELMFFEAAASQIPFNIIYISFLIFLAAACGVKGLMVTAVLAVASQIVIQLPGIRKAGYRYRLVLDLKDQYIKKMFYLVLPVLVSVAVGDLNHIVDKTMASSLTTGSISALNYSSKLNGFILAIFITAITTVFYPMFSKEAVKDSFTSLKRMFRNSVNVIIIITVPAAVGMVILAQPVIRLAFERGAFNPEATRMATPALLFYSLGLVAMALQALLYRVYYSLQDTKTPMYNGMISLGLNIIFNILLIKPMGHSGLALATSLATTITATLLIIRLRMKIGGLGIAEFISSGLKAVFSAAVMGTLVYLIYHALEIKVLGSTLLELALLVGVAALGAAVYFVLIYLLKVDEMSWFVDLFRKRLRRTVQRRAR